MRLGTDARINYCQWWIQGFPEMGANPSGWAKTIICKVFAENCMKRKEIGPTGGRGGGARGHTSLMPPSTRPVNL